MRPSSPRDAPPDRHPRGGVVLPSAHPLSRSELAIAEAGELLARGREPAEMQRLGWEALGELMAHRRRLILEDEITEAECRLGDL